jgi:hypothetical protein
MDESNGTNLKPILQILFFNKLMNIGLVLIPSPDHWRERALGTITKLGRNVLMTKDVITSHLVRAPAQIWGKYVIFKYVAMV